MTDFASFFSGKRILLTGASGTVGSSLAQELVRCGASELRLLDNNESEMFFTMERYTNVQRVVCFLGDVRDAAKVEKTMRGIDIVIHCAAFKHVILSEHNPFDAVQTNVLGVQNVIQAALNNQVSLVLFTSSDKAVNPTNVMGTTKLLGEKLVTAANALQYGRHTVFSSTRFGNVMGSRGSVVPLFRGQIERGGPVTVTDERMTRFVMTVDEAVRLVLKSALCARGGEVFVTKMAVVRIMDLARVMIDHLAPRFGHNPEDIEIQLIGAKTGEKLYEELMSDEEVRRSVELTDMFVTVPAFKSIYKEIDYSYPDVVNPTVAKPYVSSAEPAMSREDLREYLISEGVI